ncbi:MAG: XRE family transcriptional regulator [Candidatus Synechococcus spongiarum 142]|uniref:Probable transcriptional regulator ycf27 n=1 Tax=Candidatus Synechococcus spongiarum 142 TaxID=1608213 RepID=A0A6N3X706_9SYNE|nr:MAG: XRE family transcriptional regulator [Candidatus Synechococcus spongiarum 142]
MNGWPGPQQSPGDGPSVEDAQGAGSTPCKRLLVVDDEPAVRRILDTRLRMAGYTVVLAADGEEALSKFYREQPDLVVLDVMLPKLDGFGVCRQIRAESTVPIIIVSALDNTSEKVAGLELGADDYLPKPFAPRELEMRIAAVLRRQEVTAVPQPSIQREGRHQNGIIRAGHLVIDTNRRQVTCKGERLGLTYTEFSLLELLFREPGTVVPRATILEELWGYPPRKATNLRVVDVYVARLRNKLEPDPRNPELILTVRGTGYVSQGVTSISPASS